MNKIRLSKKMKTFIGVAASTLATTSVVIPLTVSCQKVTTDITEAEKQMDADFGVNEVTYNSMLTSLRQQAQTKFDDEYMGDQEQIQMAMDQLNSEIDQFNYIRTNGADGAKVSFSTLTTALRKFAFQRYNISLDRNTTAKVSDLLDNWQGFTDSMVEYMRGNNISEIKIAQFLATAKTKFDSIYTEASQSIQNHTNDAMEAINIARKRMFECFEGVNNDIALIAATNRLSQFMEIHTFEQRWSQNPNDKTLRTAASLDEVKATHPDFLPGEPIDEDLFNELFVVTDIQQHKEVRFSSDMIPGYKLTPVIKEIIQNPENNNNLIKVDWQAVSNSYIQKFANSKNAKHDLENVTAHLILGTNELRDGTPTNDSDYDTVEKVYSKSVEQENVYYYPMSMDNTAGFEKNQLASYYFNLTNSNYIRFAWMDGQQDKESLLTAYEGFFNGYYAENPGDDIEAGETWYINEHALAQSGLMVTDVPKSSTETDAPKMPDLTVSPDNFKVGEDDDANHQWIRLGNLINGVYSSRFADEHPLLTQFGKNVELCAKITMINDAQHQLTCDIYAKYRNSQLPDGQNKAWLKYIKDGEYNEGVPGGDYTVTETTNADFNISKALYYSTNGLFNNAYQTFMLYNENKFKELAKESKVALVLTYVSLGLTWAMNALALGLLIWGWIKFAVDPIDIVKQSIGFLISCISSILITIQMVRYEIHFNKKVINFSNKNDRLIGSPAFKKFKEKLDADIEHYGFVAGNEYGGFTADQQGSLQEGFEKFKALQWGGKDGARAAVNYYSFLNQQDEPKAFLAAIKEAHIAPEDLEAELEGWEDGGKFMIAAVAVEIVIMITLVIYMACMVNHYEGEILAQKTSDQNVQANGSMNGAVKDTQNKIDKAKIIAGDEVPDMNVPHENPGEPKSIIDPIQEEEGLMDTVLDHNEVPKEVDVPKLQQQVSKKEPNLEMFNSIYNKGDGNPLIQSVDWWDSHHPTVCEGYFVFEIETHAW